MGLRERKKERTKTALLDAGIDLFLSQGYEATTVDQIAAEVDVSTRTFFRYFSSKEEVALCLPAEEQEAFLAALAERPESESPFTALVRTGRARLALLRELDETDASRLLKVQRLIQTTPALVASRMRLIVHNERRLLAEVARRQGRCPADLRAQLVVSVFLAMTMACYGDCPQDPAALAGRYESLLALAEDSLRPGWDLPAPDQAGPDPAVADPAVADRPAGEAAKVVVG
ncbi:TetR family transcriptional regulator [Microbispora sp. RL4-1S]|uniref:TetR family transcriptional regulator n=1 Tax=Microbispora oryzae TaxID=2806554 RepID=A0A940WQG3_9ACTN|nr:TetR family transcriptional regulator [Microbispora oryzae]MBP2705231.1 TetR family transcriptional regulator [Microbispora oryzae]